MRRLPGLLHPRALIAVSVAASAMVLPLRAATADTVADKRAEAARLAAAIDASSQRVDSLTTRFEAAQLAKSKLDAEVAATNGSLRAATARIAETRRAVRDMAVEQFMHDGPTADPATAAIAAGDAHALAVARLFQDLALRKTQEVLDESRSAQQDYRDQLGRLRTQQQQARAAAAQLDGARQAAADAVAQQESQLRRVQGDLASLVAAERARQQAAREARTRAAVDRHSIPPRPSAGQTGGGGAPTPPADSSRAAQAVAEAQRQLGKPYRWGAAGPNSFDCSGLTMWAWRAGGVSLDHYTGAQYQQTIHIPIDQLQPGDLVFFHSDLSHVGIYVGNGQMIHAPQTGDVVRYASIYSEGAPIYAGRVRT